MRISSKLIAAGAPVAAASALAVVPAGSASAASGCWDAGFRKPTEVSSKTREMSGCPLTAY